MRLNDYRLSIYAKDGRSLVSMLFDTLGGATSFACRLTSAPEYNENFGHIVIRCPGEFDAQSEAELDFPKDYYRQVRESSYYGPG